MTRAGTPRRSELATLDAGQIALFLDVDGTLLEYAPTPDAVRVDPALIQLLRRLSLCGGGAVALVSGRSIANLDDLLAPLLLPAAGLHGFERRNAVGVYHRCALPSGTLLALGRQLMRQIAAAHPALLLEDKRFAIALHYRQAPGLKMAVENALAMVSRLVAPELEIQRGRMVVELRPANATKATAVAQFMQEPPFQGRRPIFVGDDLTDECAFEWVNSAGGLSVGVDKGSDSAASIRLSAVTEVRAWLSECVETAQ